jgi:hypothetical protein
VLTLLVSEEPYYGFRSIPVNVISSLLVISIFYLIYKALNYKLYGNYSRFFGVKKDGLWSPRSDIVVYLSDADIDSGNKYRLSLQEFMSYLSIENFFTANHNFLTTQFDSLLRIEPRMDVKIGEKISSLSEINSSLIIIGSGAKNEVRKFLLDNQCTGFRISRESDPPVKLDEHENQTFSFVDRFDFSTEKFYTFTSNDKKTFYNYAVIERKLINKHVVISCVGSRGDSTLFAVEWLFRHNNWENFSNIGEFAVCLKFKCSPSYENKYKSPDKYGDRDYQFIYRNEY